MNFVLPRHFNCNVLNFNTHFSNFYEVLMINCCEKYL